MAKLVYSSICSLDGYVADESGSFGWARPDEEVHAFVNELERPIGTYLYGRRMYETMVYWETDGAEEDQPAVVRDFAAIYYPHTLDWRGRAYPLPMWLQPQGNDLSRGLLQFTEGKPLHSPRAIWW